MDMRKAGLVALGCSSKALLSVLVMSLPNLSGLSQEDGFPVLTQDATTSKSAKVDFQQDIYPVLQTRCFDCHSGESNDGDLKLDSEHDARKGGHTGRPLLTSPAESSELFQRLISSDEGYRMPKSGDPLSATEIELFKAWLDQGANWNGVGSDSGVPQSEATQLPVLPGQRGVVEWLGQKVFEILETTYQTRFRRLATLRWILVAWIVFLVFVIATKLKQFRRRRKSSKSVLTGQRNSETISSDLTDRIFRWRFLALALGAILLAGAVLFQQGIIDEMGEQLRKASASGRQQTPIKITNDRKALVLPVYPDHPPRMGGVYYRGNDERDPSLFNGGVYRTATLEVWLINERGEKVKWHDQLKGQSLFIALMIRRAPRTTSALFSQTIFRETYLRRFRETDLLSGDPTDESTEIPFSVIETDQAWEARVPLEPAADWKAGKNAGVIYLFYGSQLFDGFKGRVHYGIRYELEHENGQLSPQSELWMGAIYDLGGRVLIPQDKEVPLSQWFDYRPLPEIESENPNDPELLGLPEHIK
jgi:hypothetical protein